jgi:UDP-2,4-diacetamido-2,4,6-trideoxy-beta-L-altropyranose hydrolase
MRLYIRVDANGKIGIGHIMRCISLAQSWKDRGGEVTFISCCDDILSRKIKEEGFSLISVNADNDLETTLTLANKDNKSWFVLDGFHFTPEYQESIYDTGVSLLVIDDTNHLPYYHANIILNQNIYASSLRYVCNEGCLRLLGSSYTLLRREFMKYQKSEHFISEEPKRILVTLGGSDPNEVMLKIKESMKRLAMDVKVVSGVQSLSVIDMPELMTWTDMAVSAAGSTCWELLFMGVPTLVVVTYDHQNKVAESLEKEKVCKTVNVTNLIEELLSLVKDKRQREEKSRLGRQLIDGNGANRVVSIMYGDKNE